MVIVDVMKLGPGESPGVVHSGGGCRSVTVAEKEGKGGNGRAVTRAVVTSERRKGGNDTLQG